MAWKSPVPAFDIFSVPGLEYYGAYPAYDGEWPEGQGFNGDGSSAIWNLNLGPPDIASSASLEASTSSSSPSPSATPPYEGRPIAVEAGPAHGGFVSDSREDFLSSSACPPSPLRIPPATYGNTAYSADLSQMTSSWMPEVSDHRLSAPLVTNSAVNEMGRGRWKGLPKTDGKTNQGGIYACTWPGCTATTSRQHDLKRHEQIHQPSRWFVCGCCYNRQEGKSFVRKDHLFQHMRQVHDMGDRPPAAQCHVCTQGPDAFGQDLFFTTEESYSKHLALDHHGGYVDCPAPGASCKLANPRSTSRSGNTKPDKAGVTSDGVSKELRAVKRSIHAAPLPETKQRKCNQRATSQRKAIVPAIATSSRRASSSTMSTGSHRDKGRQDGLSKADIVQRVFSSPPSPFGIGNLNADFVKTLICEFEIAQVKPVEFWALSKYKAFREVAKRLSMLLMTSGNLPPVAYNLPGNVLKLRGNAPEIESMKAQVSLFLSDIRAHDQPMVSSKAPRRTFPAPRASFRLGAAIANPNDKIMRIFPVRAKEDSQAISFWSQQLVSQLPKILGDRLGRNYSAGLVRQGLNALAAQLTLRIQSPNGQTEATRQLIQDEINRFCDDHSREHIPVHFSTGSVTPLAGIDSTIEGAGQIDNERSEAASDVPYFKRYWDMPGMGASIGLHGCRRVTATLGGFVSIEEDTYALSVDHFITESQNGNARSDRKSKAHNQPLTSPSLSDVDLVRQDLEQTIRDCQAGIERYLGELSTSLNSDISLDQLDQNTTLEGYGKKLQQCTIYKEEFNHPDEHFLWGEVVYRCPESRRRLNQQFARRMDWSLSTVYHHRAGENRHRYCWDFTPLNAEDVCDSSRPRGTGYLCQGTKQVVPNMCVHYFGQKSGHQRAKINPTTELVVIDGEETLEWLLISDAVQGSEAKYPGDSGAWVIDNIDNQAVGMIWGWCDVGLCFTPIEEIFANIQEQLGITGYPRLPNLANHPGRSPIPHGHSASQATLACSVREYAEKIAISRREIIASLEGTLPRLSLPQRAGTEQIYSSNVIQTPSMSPQELVLPPKDVSAEENPRATPALSISSSASPTPRASPEPSSPVTPLGEELEMVLVLDAESKGKSGSTDFDEIKVNESSDENETTGMRDGRRQLSENKYSLDFILGNGHHNQTRVANVGVVRIKREYKTEA